MMGDNTFTIGDLVAGRYRLDERIGEGGFGAVYRAYDAQRDHEVALKLLDIQSDTDARRVAREAAILRTLDHPNVVVLFDEGALRDTHYLALELLPGQDLADLLEQRLLDADETVEVVRQVAAALTQAHQAGVLHRDIKPENIRVIQHRNGPMRLKLMDFGIARPTDAGSPGVTATGEVIGTPRYMSPEQLTNKPLGPPSDLYSLGLVAIECLVGRDALAGIALADQLERLERNYAFDLTGLKHVGANLVAVLARMTARDGKDRFQSAASVVHALQAIENSPTLEPRPARSRPSSKGTMRSVAAGAAVSVLIGSIWIASTNDDSQPRRLPTAPPPTPQANVAPHPVIEPDATLSADVRLDAGPNDGTGCGLQPPFVGPGQFNFGDKTFAHVPEHYDGSRPFALVLLLHDDWHDPEHWIKTGGFVEIADEHDAIVLAPYDGIVSVWRKDEQDAARLTRLFEFARAELCLDPERVLVIGQGHGASAALALTCAPWITAMVVNARHLVGAANCPTGEQFPPFMFMAGRKDPMLPIDGGPNCVGDTKRTHEEQAGYFKMRHQCDGPSRSFFEHENGVCSTWDCDVPFVTCFTTGGRGWPNSQRRIDPQACDGVPPDLPSAQITWDFLNLAHTWRHQSRPVEQ